MALSPAQREALIRAEQTARAQVRARLVQYATSLWNGLGSWRDSDIDRFVAQIVPRVLAGQRTIAQLTDAYLARVTGASAAGLVDLDELRGITPELVYQRPAVDMRTALSQGSTVSDAIRAGALRLGSLIATDLQMANVRQARASLDGTEVGGFRRTLTGAENCALCLIASTQRYTRGALMPIHPGCDCGVEPLATGEPVPQVIDPALLEATHEQVADFAGVADRGGRAPDYRKLIVTHEHGEFGPTLAWRSDAFTGPGDLAA